jgi:formate dehydrogenase maturation protein FdhE
MNSTWNTLDGADDIPDDYDADAADRNLQFEEKLRAILCADAEKRLQEQRMSQIPPETEAEYVEKNGIFCPYCRSKNISSNKPELMDNGVDVEVECNVCGKTWTDVYRLAGIAEAEQDEGETPLASN